MKINKKTLEKLRNIINGDGTEDYRSGPKIVEFFNELGFDNAYGKGFPSRWYFTDECLNMINGTQDMDECIKKVFEVSNYIGRISYLDALINEFNQYITFDKYKVVRSEDQIQIIITDKVVINTDNNSIDSQEKEFLNKVFNYDIDELNLDEEIIKNIKYRLLEINNCVKNDLPLASILLMGSVLEGILKGVANNNPMLFNTAITAPKDKEFKVKKISDWSLSELIDVSTELGILKQDVKKYSHSLREFRNYIHPSQQLKEDFYPNINTAEISLKVLEAAILQINEFNRKI